MFTDKDYIMGIMNAFDAQEKALDHVEESDLIDDNSTANQIANLYPVAQAAALPKVKEEYDMHKEIKDDFGTEFNDLFNSLNSKYEINNNSGVRTFTNLATRNGSPKET
jgi:hypothetical protein